jgi:hypothetical protein
VRYRKRLPAILALAVAASVVTLLTGCVSTDRHSYVAPDESLDETANYYIVFAEQDDQALHEVLREALEARGIAVSSGFRDREPGDTRYRIEYLGQWRWDITWYLLSFDMRIYDPRNDLLVAASSSLRTSLARREPRAMVDEVLDALFPATQVTSRSSP